MRNFEPWIPQDCMNLGRLLCTVEFVQEQREPLITPFDLTVAFWISTMISFHNNAARFFASCRFHCSGCESSSTPSWSKDAQACLFFSRKASHKAYVVLTEGIWPVERRWRLVSVCRPLLAPQIQVLWATLIAVPVRIAIQQPSCPVSCAFKMSSWTTWLPSHSASTSSASWGEALLSLPEMEL